MRRGLRILALVLVLTASILWLALGANLGWTRTTVSVKIVDEVTGLEGVENRKQFVPGIDLLALAILGAGGLAAVSFLFPRQPSNKNNGPTC